MTFTHDILSNPLAFHGPALATWLQRHERITGLMMAYEQTESQGLAEYVAQFVNQRKPYEVANGLAFIHVNDVLAMDTTPIDRMQGMTDYSHLIAELSQAVSDPNVRAIVVDANSPGGSASGAPEAAAALANAAQIKPVVTNVGSMCASAAMYFAAGSSAIVASQSATVGSIGTICSFLDFSAMMQNSGIAMHVFTAPESDLKLAARPFRAPTTAEANFLQSRVEAMNADFTGWVSKHRPSVTADSMRGQWFSGTEALSRGLVDQVGTRQDAIDAANALARL